MATRDEAIDAGSGRRQFHLVVDMEASDFRGHDGEDDPYYARSGLASALDQLVGKVHDGTLDMRDGATVRLFDTNGNYVGKGWIA
jgi:hypothetical protein